MRISVHSEDPGYLDNAHLYEVLFNGTKLENCVVADEELGVVLCYVVDELGRTVRDKEYVFGWKTVMKKGRVELIPPISKG